VWARGGQAIDEGPLQQLQALGAPPAVIDEWREALEARQKAETFEVWPCHWHAVNVFTAMTTQWHWREGPRGSCRAGLRYEALGPVLREHREISHRQPFAVLMRQLRCLEGQALEHA
jgi:hypothetical protein